ncbi:MAG: fumarate reductase/succinate dehydrogenase flavoprotein subunit, partial [Candidatus Binatia bacterium]|nr:fumarate reductase/succinate dehydrogenase flavoprotein subunit [Candidatus Binatia bacterium]
WHLALDLHSMLTVSEAATLSALERKESRGGHTRDDYPKTDPNLAKVNLVTRTKNGALELTQEPLPEMPEELKKLVEEQN